jgi:hypothetical protein
MKLSDIRAGDLLRAALLLALLALPARALDDLKPRERGSDQVSSV